ncbi:formyltransferase family protein [Idiomarina sp.]|uniref:formyltransferase family protein n=1 Tax=Idiomarina sp. TaxID=1874361 RepID=UPI002E9BFB50|nr:formyltransferase family protein [Pseudomonadota bacterium]
MTIKILFMGRKEVSAKALEWLNSKPNVEVIGVLTDSHLNVSPTAQVAKKLGIPTLQFHETLEKLKNGDIKFDLGVSVLFWRKLKDEFLTVPSLGIINFHPAPLPYYKGTAGYNLAILEGREDWACSAHYVDEEIDTGDIIKVDWFDIDAESETAQSLERKSTDVLYGLFESVVEKALTKEGKLETTPNRGGVYTSRSTMEEMKKVLDGDDLERKVRAFWFPPYDGAYIEMNGNRYTLVSQKLLRDLAPEGASSLFSSPSK